MRKLIHVRAPELPRVNMIVEQQVDFAKSAVFGFGQPEPAPYVAQGVGEGVEEGGAGAPVPTLVSEY